MQAPMARNSATSIPGSHNTMVASAQQMRPPPRPTIPAINRLTQQQPMHVAVASYHMMYQAGSICDKVGQICTMAQNLRESQNRLEMAADFQNLNDYCGWILNKHRIQPGSSSKE
jgi:hypothetical protein